ncbi:MAG: hypothetical protein KAI79_10435, partial [Bacteroidales bacterium]|nr:hypothetical protein [Bacteroidales bacterium]
LTIFTSDSLAEFRLFVDGDQKNNFHVDSITIEGIDSSNVEIVINFKHEGFADETESVSFIETQDRVYEIVAKPSLMKSLARTGRGLGKKLKIGNHENEGKLTDVFLLKDRTILAQFKE